MKKDDAIEKIATILRKHLDLSIESSELLAERIYADVVATAVDDERSNWVMLTARGGHFDS